MTDRASKLTEPSSWPMALPPDVGGSHLGPPLPSWWPRPAKRIRLDAATRRTPIQPWYKIGLGPGRVILQIATRWR